MANTTTSICLPPLPSLEMAWRDVDSSFERFCLTAGIGAIEQMLREDAQQLTGAPHCRGGGRVGAHADLTRSQYGIDMVCEFGYGAERVIVLQAVVADLAWPVVPQQEVIW